MFKIGCHLSSSKGFLWMAEKATEIGASTFQYFTRNPRGGAVKPINHPDIEAFLRYIKEKNMVPPLAHAPYTLNACASQEKLRHFALEVMSDDISRLELIEGSMYNFHPGNHVSQGVDIGISYIVRLLNKVIQPDQRTIILLETMAGKGTEIGRSFEELSTIINQVELNDKLGVCLDTCHVFDAGYDIVNELDAVLDELDKTVGIGRLKAVHLNDSKNTRGSHKDRHEKIGKGFIGLESFSKIINHPALKSLPFYLETPNDSAGYAEEIASLKSIYTN